jgi:chromate transport protein ChrA
VRQSENMSYPTFRDTLWYSTLVWITGVIGGPIVAAILVGVNFNELPRMDAFFMIVLYGALFSLPSWLLLMFCTHFLHRFSPSTLFKKGMLMILAVSLTLLPFYVLIGNKTFREMSFVGGYVIAILAGIALHKFTHSTETTTETTTETLDNL